MRTAGVVAMGLAASSAAAEDLEPRLWSCQDDVKINGIPVACDRVGQGMKLKVDDKVELTRGRALVTGWSGEILPLVPGKAVRIGLRPAPPASPSTLRTLQEVFELLFGGARRSGVMKANGHGAEVVAQPKLLAPASLTVTEWKGPVQWEMPKDRAFALRVRSADGASIGPPRILDQPTIELSSLGLGDALSVTLELLVLDHRPEGQAAYLSLPASLALRQPGRPVLGVVTTELRRAPMAPQANNKALTALTPLQRAARLLAAGELARAREEAQKASPEGLPEPWQRSLSGVRVEVAP